MKLSTNLLKEATNKAIKGASFNKLLPITSMLGLITKDNKLLIASTDMSNHCIAVIDKVVEDDTNITVDADKFSKLIAKITTDDVELIIEDEVLVIKANGTYKLPIITDEDGAVQFPIPEIPDMSDASDVLLTSILSVYNINKASLSDDMSTPHLTGYYCDEDTSISADGESITFNNISLFGNTNLVSSTMMDLLALNTQEKIKYKKDDLMFFVADNLIIVGPELEGIENYPIETIKDFLGESFSSSCAVSKSGLIDVLDRLTIFIDPYDKNGANFRFTRAGITVSSRQSSSVENVAYIKSDNFNQFSCVVDVPQLRDVINSIPEDTIKICYGNESALRLESGNTIIIISLMEEENE